MIEILLILLAAFVAYCLLVALVVGPYAYVKAYCQLRWGWWGGREAFESDEKKRAYERESRRIMSGGRK